MPGDGDGHGDGGGVEVGGEGRKPPPIGAKRQPQCAVRDRTAAARQKLPPALGTCPAMRRPAVSPGG
jgi:hypothetical protein